MQATENSKKKQILVVEDEGLIAVDTQRRLQRMGYSVPEIAHTGEEALRYAREIPFDLVLMDIRLQGTMDGVVTAERLKEELQVPVVYITAHADQETIQRAQLTEPFGYLVKPVGDASLRSVVQIAIHKHEMECRVRTSEGWLATTINSVGAGIIACDPLGEVVLMNPAAEQLTGWNNHDARGRSLMDVLALYEEGTERHAKNPVFDLFPDENRAYTLNSKHGSSLPVEIECFENRSSEDLLGSIVLLRNISARRESEGRLMQSERMEAVSRMAGGLANEFNNMLMVVMDSSEELYGRLSGDDRRLAAQIKQAASTGDGMVRQLVTMSRQEAIRPEVLDVNKVVRDLQRLIGNSLGESRTLLLNLASRTGFVWGDRSRLKQVFLNLALNARAAMPGSGELQITTSLTEIEAQSPQARQHAPGTYVRLRVTNNGEAAEQSALPRIFEPFSSAKFAGEGQESAEAVAGLGLSVVHSIIAQSGGTIRATSEAGRGTSFDILLPAIGTCQASEGISGPAPTVLLVEDEDPIRRLMFRSLERDDLQLLEAKNAEDAELIAQAYPDPIQVLVTDMIMPGRSGKELAERLSLSRPDVKVLYISGYRHDSPHPEGENLQMLSKPFPTSELARRIRLLLDDAHRY
ncbi:MAG: response regulator [Acidobacteriia bacterium]|nr:response regulator [Terriglobia bacterium]